MNLKSLLIGSAAALTAVPAFAADVIIAEPEPVEYVEVCDVAGAGYFYIPGSRTCLQISGLVRHQLDFQGDRDVSTVTTTTANATIVNGFVVTPGTAATVGTGAVVARGGVVQQLAVGTAPLATDIVLQAGVAPTAFANGLTTLQGAQSQDGIRSLVRGEVNFRTFTETELGDLTSFIRFRGNDNNANPFSVVAQTDGDSFNTEVTSLNLNGSVFLNNAVIGLGGLSLGLSDSLYDGGIAGEFDSFGGDRVHFIRYTADLGAFSASLSLEAERENLSQNNYVPNVVGQIAGDIGAFSVTAWAAYDDGDADDVVTQNIILTPGGAAVPFTLVDEDSFSAKITGSFDLGIFGVAAGATYNEANNNFSNGYEFSAAASATVGLGEKASVTFGGQYFWNQLANAQLIQNVNGGVVDVFLPNRTIDAIDAYSIGANVDYEIVDGFDVKVAVNYSDIVIDDAALTTANTTVVDADGAFNAFVRFDRSF